MKPKWKRRNQKQRAKIQYLDLRKRIDNARDLAKKVGLIFGYRSISEKHIAYYWLEDDKSMWKIIRGDLKTIEQYLHRLWQLKSFL
jgi:hypothetical protein